MSVVIRETKETRIRVQIERGSGAATVKTGVPFLDHMLATLARYSGLDLGVTATGDLRHHLIEDVAIAVGSAVAALLPAAIGFVIARAGVTAIGPMVAGMAVALLLAYEALLAATGSDLGLRWPGRGTGSRGTARVP